MDTPWAARVPSRPSLLQLLRSFIRQQRGLLGAQEPRAEQQEPGAAVEPGGGQAEHTEPARGEQTCQEPYGDAERESRELLLGELQEVSLQGSLGSTSRSCLTASGSSMEPAAAGDGVEALGGTVAPQSSETAGEEGTAAAEGFDDRTLEMDGLLPGLGAADEDVTSSAHPELMFSMDFDTEWEKEQLLKANQAAGSPKAELSLWNRLISMNRHQRTPHKAHASRSMMELESEEEPLLMAAENGPPTPELPDLPAKPSAALPVYRFYESRVTTGCFGRNRAELGADGEGAPGEG